MPVARIFLAALILAAGLNGAACAVSRPSDEPLGPDNSSVDLEAAANALVEIRVTALEDARSLAELGKARQGSGVVIDPQGHILTSLYLILEADDIEVVSRSGSRSDAKIVATDFETGIAVLETVDKLPVDSLRFGTAEKIAVNEPLVVLSTDGTDQIVTVSYVVAKVPYQAGWEFAIDEAIFTHPAVAGWNGAGLVNEHGQLLGIGSLLIRAIDPAQPQARSPDAFSMMFIPIDRILPALESLIANGRRDEPERPWIGVLTRQGDDGCEVTGVLPESPADEGGLTAHDLIVSINGKPVQSQRALYEALWASGSAGSPLTVTVKRGESLHRLELHSVGLSEYYRTAAED